MRLNYGLLISMAIICMLIAIPLSTAIENPTVDVNINMAGFGILKIDFIINNPSQRDILLTGFEFSIKDPIELLGDQRRGTSILIKSNKSITYSTEHYLIGGDPLKRFYRQRLNVTVSGSLSIQAGSDSFAVPFYKTTNIFLETAGANKSISPNITDIKFKVSRLTDENGEARVIITTTSISIYNPNPIVFYMPELDCDVTAMYKKNETMRTLKPLYSCGVSSNSIMLKPMDTFFYSAERTISDNETIQYFTSGEPKYIKIKGSAFLIPNETGWSPAYFEPTFNTLITITNGSVAGGNVASTPTPTPTSTSIQIPTPKKNVSGFKLIFAIAGIFAVAFLLKKRS